MFKQSLIFAFGLACGAALMYSGLRYHVVRAKDRWHMIPKTEANLSGIYVDVRGFELSDWDEHPKLVSAILKANRPELLSEIENGLFRETGKQLLRNVIN